MRYLLCAVALLAAGCSDDTTKADTGLPPDKGTGADKPGIVVDKRIAGEKVVKLDGGAVPTVQTEAHPGWKQANCATSGCHTLPTQGHPAMASTSECAKCHGANGACDPNGPNSTKKDHLQSLTCMSCHLGKHENIFKTDPECVACHFAEKGTSACP